MKHVIYALIIFLLISSCRKNDNYIPEKNNHQLQTYPNRKELRTFAVENNPRISAVYNICDHFESSFNNALNTFDTGDENFNEEDFINFISNEFNPWLVDYLDTLSINLTIDSSEIDSNYVKTYVHDQLEILFDISQYIDTVPYDPSKEEGLNKIDSMINDRILFIEGDNNYTETERQYAVEEFIFNAFIFRLMIDKGDNFVPYASRGNGWWRRS